MKRRKGRKARPRGAVPMAAAGPRLLRPGAKGKVPPAPKTIEELLRDFAARGIKTRPFDVEDQVIAPEPITDKGSRFDAGRFFDSWALVPSIDAKISFEGPPSGNRPTVAAGTTFTVSVRKRVVYYQAANAGASGTLSIYMLRYAED